MANAGKTRFPVKELTTNRRGAEANRRITLILDGGESVVRSEPAVLVRRLDCRTNPARHQDIRHLPQNTRFEATPESADHPAIAENRNQTGRRFSRTGNALTAVMPADNESFVLPPHCSVTHQESPRSSALSHRHRR
jgi:hypothetical protein